MKRILIFSTAYLPLVGGAELALKELTDRMAGFEFDMVTAAIRPGLPPVETLGRIRVFRLGVGRGLDKWLLPWTAFRKAATLHREKPYDAIWVMMASYAAFAAERFKRRFPEVPMLLTLQEGDPPEFIARRTRFVRGWFRGIFRRADALQSISTFLDHWGKSQGFSGKIAQVIPNGVDIRRFDVPKKPHDGFVIVTTSRLVPKNGVDLLIKAMPMLDRQARLVIAGAGPLEDELRALVFALGLKERVTFAGEIAHADLPGFLAAGDAFCRPSRSEGLGISFIEAMAVGLPVVATPVGGIPDIITDGRNGLLVRPESPEAVAEGLDRIMRDHALAERLSSEARRAAEKYRWDDIAQRMDGLFQGLTTDAAGVQAGLKTPDQPPPMV